MATRWDIAPYQARPTWTMTDGTEIECPMIETTPSRRRWRVQGTKDSVSQYDLPQAIERWMRDEVARQGKTAWFVNVTDNERVKLHEQASPSANSGFSFDQEPQFDLTKTGAYTVGFEFVCKDAPQLNAILWVSLNIGRNMQMTVSSEVTYRPNDPSNPTLKTHARTTSTGLTVPEAPFLMTDVKRFGANPRGAVESYAEMLRLASNVDTLTLPDGRSRNGKLLYSFERSNYSNDVYRRSLDFVQAGPSLERLNQLMRQVRDELCNLGIVTDVKKDFDVQALLSGRLSELQVRMLPQDTMEDGDDNFLGVDRHHVVNLDLVHGTFAVSCTRQNLEDVAAAWEVAKFKAEMSGETDVLLAYAQAFNLKTEQDRLARIIRQRKARR